jgi:glycine betaine/proline transport system ATP-binding protein
VPADGSTIAEVAFRGVDVIFGDRSGRALAMLDRGEDRNAILEATGSVVGVADANLEIGAGEICVLMGLSGSGKSTLLRCVNRLNQATRGEVLVADGDGTVDVAACDQATLRRLRTHRIAMVFQQFALLPWRTVAENVGFGLELRGMNRAERERVVRDKLAMVNLDAWADKFAHELSGGMQQRVGLARAFATDADILLMDEPFSALDPLIRNRLQDELLELQRTLRKTIVFVSHDLDEAMKIGTNIAIMEDGRIVQHGPPEAIVLEPANDYVADFVAHMNPLNVLTGSSLMTPVAALGAERGGLVVGPIRLDLDPAGELAAASRAGEPVHPVRYDPEHPFERGDLVLAPPAITMREAVELRQTTGLPVILADGPRVIGVIGDDELYRGILRQTRLAAARG